MKEIFPTFKIKSNMVNEFSRKTLMIKYDHFIATLENTLTEKHFSKGGARNIHIIRSISMLIMEEG